MSAFRDRQTRWPDLLAYPGWDDLAVSGLAYGFDCGAGWLSLIDAVLTDLAAWHQQDPAARLRVLHVKEKFGRLVVDIDMAGARPETRAAIAQRLRAAAAASAQICESCGQPGVWRVTDGWWRTRCARCELRDWRRSR